MYVNCAHGKGIKFIREELRSGSGYVKKDFFKIFREKSPGGIKKEGTAAGQIILKDVQDGNYQEAKTKTLFYILCEKQQLLLHQHFSHLVFYSQQVINL